MLPPPFTRKELERPYGAIHTIACFDLFTAAEKRLTGFVFDRGLEIARAELPHGHEEQVTADIC